MQPDLLQQLRDIHLPAAPGWWPPAPGWWLLALLGITLLILAIRALQRRMHRQRPLRHARRLYGELYAGYRSGAVSAMEYLHLSNELLKRTMIHGLGEAAARKANDEEWLALLDARAGSDRFTTGPGRLLGNQRFRSSPEADVESLHPLLLRFFKGVRA